MKKDILGRVKFTELKNITISTVDLSMRYQEYPILDIADVILEIKANFETAVQIKNKDWIIVKEYKTLKEAEKGHDLIVTQCKKGKTNWKDIRL